MKHNIYLLGLATDEHAYPQGDWYDCYDGHIVIADTPEEARKSCPYDKEGSIWTDSNKTTCKKIGESNKQKEVVLSSYNKA